MDIEIKTKRNRISLYTAEEKRERKNERNKRYYLNNDLYVKALNKYNYYNKKYHDCLEEIGSIELSKYYYYKKQHDDSFLEFSTLNQNLKLKI
jgi:hypothetical protein